MLVVLAWWLRDAGEGEIIAVATFVVDLESVAVIGENQAVGKIIEDSRNGRRCAVIDDGGLDRRTLEMGSRGYLSPLLYRQRKSARK